MTRSPFTGGLGLALYGSPEEQAIVEEFLLKAGVKILHKHLRKTAAGQRPIVELTLQLPEDEKP